MRRARVRSRRIVSCSRASSALRAAMSASRRFSPRWAERTSTAEPRRSDMKSSSRSGSSNPRGTTTWPRDRDLAAVVLEGEAPQHVGFAPAGGVLEVEAVPVGEPSVAQVEELDVGGRPRRRRRPGCRPSRGCGGRRPGARTGGARPSAGCGSGRRPRTRAPPRPPSSPSRGAARAAARGPTGTRSPSRSRRGSPRREM